MEFFLPLFIGIPLIGFIVSLLLPKTNERAIFLSMAVASGIQMVLAIIFTIQWAMTSGIPLNIREITLYRSADYTFFIDLFFDHITATYLIMSSLLTFMIAHFSRGYMHKDGGYKRYFNTMLLYFVGVQIIIFSGNFETLFIGWEILGVSSFLLIAYYRDRYLPVRNGFKVFSMYRIADISILLAMWLLHHLFHENITFLQMRDHAFVFGHVDHHEWVAIIISAFIILAALVKSAQFPFSSWLPRAMEGPTPSSSIFYGSIAVHIGIYLLLRTYPFWEGLTGVKYFVMAIGVLSSFVANSIAKVQSSIKGQIGYSSIAQIGIMMVEVALGLETLALIHLVGNAFLRSYQLLVSPSIVTYMLRDQFFNFKPKKKSRLRKHRVKWNNTFYVLALNEYYMDNVIYKYLWFPFKRWGGKVAFLNLRLGVSLFLVGAVIFGALFFDNRYEYFRFHEYLPDVVAMLALGFVLRAFTIRKHPFEAWLLLIINHFFIAFAISFNAHFNILETIFYLSGIVVAGVIGLFTLRMLSKQVYFSLDDYYGHAIKHKTKAFIFLICSLSLMGFPITTTFLGEDLLFSHIHIDQIFLLSLISVNFTIGGIAVMRIYTRVFLGPNHQWERSEARRSS